jgi:hypothetical protein
LKGHHQAQMKTDNRLSRRIPASGVHDHKQPQWWLAPLLPFLKHVNMRTLALLMFLGVALLNTSDGKDAQTKEPAAGISNTEVVTDGRHESSPVAPLILWQLTKRIAQAFTSAVNDPSLIEYARQQGSDIPDLQTTPCQGTARSTSTY